MSPRSLAALAATLLLCPSSQAQDQPKMDAPDRAGCALTIYSSADPRSFDPKQLANQRAMNPYNFQTSQIPGYGVVRETRGIELDEGRNTVRFTDVAAGIDPTTVSFKSLTAPDTTAVLEQNYEYDLVGADKLMQKYLSKTIRLTRKQGEGQFATVEGTLLSAEPGMIVLQGEQADQPVRLIPRNEDLGEILLPKLPEGLITKPTLVWLVQAQQAGQHKAQVSYQTDGMTWRADYNVVVAKDDKAADLGAWVSILNESGASYPEAKLKLVAGDVQRVQPPQPMYRMESMMAAPRAAGAAAPGFEEKAFFEYHLYTLGRPTTLPDRSTKQIELFPAKAGVPVEKVYVYYGLPEGMRSFVSPNPNPDRNLGNQSNKKVDIYLKIKNDEKTGLGIPLPAGRVRVYQRDEADAALEFVGEDTIEHTPKNEELLIKLGSAFDVVGERTQTDFQVNLNGHVIVESFKIALRNHKDAAIKVIVKENLIRWTNWQITQSSDQPEKQDYRTVHFPVTVPADGEKVITYTVKYTW